MHKEFDFEDIRPYHDHEINPALKRIVAVPEFGKILDFLFPGKNKEQITGELTQITTALGFQKHFMHPLVNSIVEKTSAGLTTSGFENLQPGTPYLFVANHRDIVLDSAILQVVLLDFGHETSEITFGSNLMTHPFIIDIGRVNRMFKVYRGSNHKELLRNAQVLSAYIRHTIKEKRTSAWIAQRGGRTKDGNDRTESGLLKMFNMSGSKDFKTSFGELNIVPLSVSYEYEPCGAFKVKELAAACRGISYQKEASEDFISVITGITQPKGHIHLAACSPINILLNETDKAQKYNDKICMLATIIDNQIYRHYRLWPSNFMAYDLLYNSSEYTGHYTPNDIATFRSYLDRELSNNAGDPELNKELLLKIYANPVINVRSL